VIYLYDIRVLGMREVGNRSDAVRYRICLVLVLPCFFETVILVYLFSYLPDSPVSSSSSSHLFLVLATSIVVVFFKYVLTSLSRFGLFFSRLAIGLFCFVPCYLLFHSIHRKTNCIRWIWRFVYKNSWPCIATLTHSDCARASVTFPQ